MPELQPGDPRRLGSYELVERLGEGGQGVVYLGTGPDGTKVAVKLLRPDLTEDELARGRFVREFQSAKRVKQFCTAQVLEADVAGDRPYIVSEYIPGPSLYRLVTDEGPRRGAALERLAIGTVTALVAIHKAGIVHRDFKPHNVLMGPDGPRVIDFGIARALDLAATVSTQAIGTPAYMAPEQVMGASLTNAVDVFSWASVMVFAATGRPPFGQDTIPAVINRILSQRPDLDHVPDELRVLLQECLAKEPERRPSAAAVLMRLLGQESADEAPPTTLDAAPPVAAATMIQPAGTFDFDSDDLRRIAAGAGVAGAEGAETEPVQAAGFGSAQSGTTTPGLPPASAWNTQQPPHRSNRVVAVSAAVGALALAAVVGVMVWLLTSNGSNTGSNSNTSTSSPAVSDSASSTPSTSATQQDSQAPTQPQPASHTPRHSVSPSNSVSPTGGDTGPGSPPVSPTGGGGSPGPTGGGPTHGQSGGPRPT